MQHERSTIVRTPSEKSPSIQLPVRQFQLDHRLSSKAMIFKPWCLPNSTLHLFLNPTKTNLSILWSCPTLPYFAPLYSMQISWQCLWFAHSVGVRVCCTLYSIIYRVDERWMEQTRHQSTLLSRWCLIIRYTNCATPNLPRMPCSLCKVASLWSLHNIQTQKKLFHSWIISY